MENISKPKEFTLDDRFPKDMDYGTLLDVLGFGKRDIIVTIINPVRKEEYYKEGRLVGFKSGIWGSGHSNYKNGFPHSFDSSKQHWIKKPKIHVAYNIFTFGGKDHSDWIDVDNCRFKIVKK